MSSRAAEAARRWRNETVPSIRPDTLPDILILPMAVIYAAQMVVEAIERVSAHADREKED